MHYPPIKKWPKKRVVPRSVRSAQLDGDTELLSYLGRLGNKVKTRRARARRERALNTLLAGAREMALQAHEDICPVDD